MFSITLGTLAAAGWAVAIWCLYRNGGYILAARKAEELRAAEGAAWADAYQRLADAKTGGLVRAPVVGTSAPSNVTELRKKGDL